MAYTKIVVKENGQWSRIVFTDYALPGFYANVGIDVFVKQPGNDSWELLVQSPENRKQSMAMSVAEYVAKGRHPMFYALTMGEMLKASVEAKRFGYMNPYIKATLQLKYPDGSDASVPVVVDSGKGLLLEQPEVQDTGSSNAHVLHFVNEQFQVESNNHAQFRVVDLPQLQAHVARIC